MRSSLDMENGASPNAHTVEEVFRDLKARRAGIIKALTTDFDRCYQLCDPEKENLCLYGFPDGNWAVTLPAEEVPSELPEPALGINFARDGMPAQEWASLVAVHSDSWLLSVAFYYGARFEFRQGDRMRLFDKINDLPTIFEVVKEFAEEQKKTKASVSEHRRNKLLSKLKGEISVQIQIVKEEDGDGQEETLCGACDENDGTDEFWICCDACEKWFHGKCVKITAARAEHIKHYKCPSCSNKKPRQ